MTDLEVNLEGWRCSAVEVWRNGKHREVKANKKSDNTVDSQSEIRANKIIKGWDDHKVTELVDGAMERMINDRLAYVV